MTYSYIQVEFQWKRAHTVTVTLCRASSSSPYACKMSVQDTGEVNDDDKKKYENIK